MILVALSRRSRKADGNDNANARRGYRGKSKSKEKRSEILIEKTCTRTRPEEGGQRSSSGGIALIHNNNPVNSANSVIFFDP